MKNRTPEKKIFVVETPPVEGNSSFLTPKRCEHNFILEPMYEAPERRKCTKCKKIRLN
jgi:hypothetical protein